MPRVGFETTIPVFGRAKTIHTLDGAAINIYRNEVAEKKETEFACCMLLP
jgi:hypothetical protein